ncbi:hypothetical protein BI343_10105 [Chromobacterium amazonense]|nr:hypothetical protein BI343_10105 [Chromobacterium amazonense]
MLRRQGSQHLLRQAAGFGTEQKNVPGLVGNPVMARGAFRRRGENPSSVKGLQTSRPIFVDHDAGILVIIEPRSPQLGILKREAQRFDQMQFTAGVGT